MVTYYSPQIARAAELERLHQAIRTYKVDDGILLTAAPVPPEVQQAARAPR